MSVPGTRPIEPTAGDDSPAAAVGSRDLVLRHLAGEPVARLPLMPITMMFAADLSGIQYGDYCRDHELLVRAQCAVAERFGFDQVSCISDPAREASDLGARITWFEDQPPAIDEADALLTDKAILARLRVPDPLAGNRMCDRVGAAALFRAVARDRWLVEGWVEGPCAEGADLRGINTLMLDFFDDPAFVHDLFGFTVRVGETFARAQINAGVDIVGVGDAAASLVGPAVYDEFVWPYERRLIASIHEMGSLVRLHVCGNTQRIVGRMATLGADVIDIDSPVPMAEARSASGPDQILLGNLAPVETLLNGGPEAVWEAVADCHRVAGPRFVVGAGCEIPRATPPDNVEAMAGYARTHRP